LEVPSPGVLGNDYDPQGGALAVTLVGPAAIGVVDLNVDGSFTYTAPGDASGNDEFTYKVTVEGRESNHAKVTITFNNQGGELPVAQDDDYVVEQNQALDVPHPGILANDYDPRGKKLKVELIDNPLGGELYQNGDGSFNFTPAVDFAGEDRFTYRVKAASLFSNDATVAIKVLDVTAPTVEWSGEFYQGGIFQVDGGRLTLTANAADNHTLREVVFHRWDAANEVFVLMGSDSQSPYELEIDTGELNLEWNQVFVRSYDSFDNASESPYIWLYCRAAAAHREFLPVVIHP
jgi:hypothetical protein